MKSSLHLFAVSAVSVALFACSSAEPSEVGPGIVSGSVNGVSLTPLSATAYYRNVATKTDGATTTHVPGLVIVLSDQPNTCGRHIGKGSTNLILTLPHSGKGGANVVVDANQRSANKGEVEVDFNAIDSACKDKVATTAKGGSVTIHGYFMSDSPEESSINGVFDVDFPEGHLSGHFVSAWCNEPAPVVESCPE